MGKNRNKTCFVPGCKTGYKSQSLYEKVSAFKVPREVLERKKWARNIPRDDRELQENDCVCEKHFVPKDIIKFIEINNVNIIKKVWNHSYSFLCFEGEISLSKT